MLPWNKLPKDLQKYILISVILSSGAATASCWPRVPTPIICDPVPPPPITRIPTDLPPITVYGDPTAPPPVTPTPTKPSTPPFTPIICDPMPPPTTRITPTATPMVCDPAPPPSIVRPQQRYLPSAVISTVDTNLPGALVQGRVLDTQGRPMAGILVTAQLGTQKFLAGTDSQGRYTFDLRTYGDYVIFIADDKPDGVNLRVRQYDKNTIDWTQQQTTSGLLLPLAEIRTVDIVLDAEGSFQADTPWPGARLTWSVTGGSLNETANRVTWQPPSTPGRYLLQVVADWGQEGLAVNSTILTVEGDGSISMT